MVFSYLLLQLLCGLFALVLSITLQRPQSRYNTAPRYHRHSHWPPGQPHAATNKRQDDNTTGGSLETDYVVIGGGAGGLAAARTLLEADASSEVWLVEAGADPLPSHPPLAGVASQHPSRAWLGAPQAVGVPVGACPGAVQRPSTAVPHGGVHRWRALTQAVLDWTYVCRRPMRGVPGSPPSSPSDAAESSSSSSWGPTHTKPKREDPLLAYAPYPQGKGVGGTYALGWGVELPSAFRRGPTTLFSEEASPIPTSPQHAAQWSNDSASVRSSGLASRIQSTDSFRSVDPASMMENVCGSSYLAAPPVAAQQHEPDSGDVPPPVEGGRATGWWRALKTCYNPVAMHPLVWSFSKTLGLMGLAQPLDAGGSELKSSRRRREDRRRRCRQHRRETGQKSNSWFARIVSRRPDAAAVTKEGMLTEEKDDGTVAERWEALYHGMATRAGNGAVLRPYLYLDVDSHQLPLSTALFRRADPALLSRLHVLTGQEVTGLRTAETAQKGGVVVTHVYCAPSGRPTAEKDPLFCGGGVIRVRRGVVVAAGLRGTPAVLSSLAPSPFSPVSMSVRRERVWCRDALVLPLLYKAHRGMTLDAHLRRPSWARQWRAMVMGTPTAANTPLVECLGAIAVPECGPLARLLLIPFPFGGRNPTLFYQLGLDRILATYEDAMMVLLVLTGVEDEGLGMSPDQRGRGLGHWITLPSSNAEKAESPTPDLQLQRRSAVPLSASSSSSVLASNFSVSFQEKVEDAFLRGIQVCRAAVTMKPLSVLLEGNGEQEALDYTLLREDPSKALRLAARMHTPLSKLSQEKVKELLELLEWARNIAKGDAYLKAYIAQHARWLGFGSGTSEGFLEESPTLKHQPLTPGENATSSHTEDTMHNTPSFAVKGVCNVVVGDCSAVRESTWRSCGVQQNALLAGNVSSATDAGYLAALELVSRGSTTLLSSPPSVSMQM